MRKRREEKAITLIALIITIVVLLILAVVAINAVTGDGIIQHAVNAKTEYQKAQDAEEDMLAYYEGVLQSGEVVPTVEQLQEKYEFIYFSSLKRAIENINGTENTEADSNTENAVAGIYVNNGNKYVVLMKDTEESTDINVTEDVTINLGGKTLSLTADSAYLNFAANTMCTIDGRLGGSLIQKNISAGNGILYTGQNTDLTINSGKYSMEGEFSNGFRMIKVGANNDESTEVVSKNFKISNAILILNNKAETISGKNRLIATVAEKTIIENCKLTVNAETGDAQAVLSVGGQVDINKSDLYVASNAGVVYAIVNNAALTVSDTNIYADIDYAKGTAIAIMNNAGSLRFYSGTVIGAYNALYVMGNDTKTYIYGGTFAGYLWGAFNIKGVGSKTYVENTIMKHGDYIGKYNYTNVTPEMSWMLGGGPEYNNNELYMDNCTIIGNGEKSISLSNTSGATGNILKISNSKVVGIVEVDVNQYLYLGKGMNNTETTGTGSITKEDVSYKGYDKILMTQN